MEYCECGTCGVSKPWETIEWIEVEGLEYELERVCHDCRDTYFQQKIEKKCMVHVLAKAPNVVFFVMVGDTIVFYDDPRKLLEFCTLSESKVSLSGGFVRFGSNEERPVTVGDLGVNTPTYVINNGEQFFQMMRDCAADYTKNYRGKYVPKRRWIELMKERLDEELEHMVIKRRRLDALPGE